MTGILKKVDQAAKEGNTSAGQIVYRGEPSGKTIVGYWLDGLFVVLSRHATRGGALNKINALNGGSGTVFDKDGNLATHGGCGAKAA